jgi:HEAT repeat protein
MKIATVAAAMLCTMALAGTGAQAQGYDKKETEKILKDAAKKLTAANVADREQAATMFQGYIQCPYRQLYEPVLLAALKDSSPKVRIAAANALLKLQAVTAIPDLIALVGDPNEDVRFAASYALGGFGVAAKSAEPALRKAHEAAKAQRRSVEEGTMQEAMSQVTGKTFPSRRYSCP